MLWTKHGPERRSRKGLLGFRSNERQAAPRTSERRDQTSSHFFELTGTKSPKQRWKFTKAGEEWFCFAGLWRPMPEGGEAFTLLTTAPGPDVAPIHDRQMVVLERSDWSAWLEETRKVVAP